MDGQDDLPSTGQEELRKNAKRACQLLDEIADLQEDLKQLKAEVKAVGYDMKAFNQIVREMRRGADYQAAQLELELVVDTYRKAAGLPVTLEAAQEAARIDAEQLPEDPDEDPESDEERPRRRLGKGLEELSKELRDDVKAGRVSIEFAGGQR